MSEEQLIRNIKSGKGLPPYSDEAELPYSANHVYREGYNQGVDDATEDIAKILDCFLDTASELMPEYIYCDECYEGEKRLTGCRDGRGGETCRAKWREIFKNRLKENLKEVLDGRKE